MIRAASSLMAAPGLILPAALLSLFALCPAWGKTIADVRLSPDAMSPACTEVAAEQAVSTQASTHYRMVETYTPSAPPRRKEKQSFDCGSNSGTIYYYEYSTKEDAAKAAGFTKGLIWGEEGRSSTLHPEAILASENVLIVVSSRDSEYFVNALVYGIPGDAGKKLGEAMETYKTKDYARAEQQLRAVAESAPNSLPAQLYLGHALFFQRKAHEAIGPYERARDLASGGAELDRVNERILFDQLGMSYAMDGRFPDAKRIFEAAIRRDPDYPMSYYNLACTHAEMGRLDEALASLKSGYARRHHMLEGETFPDPRTDASFRKYLDDETFKAAMKEMGY